MYFGSKNLYEPCDHIFLAMDEVFVTFLTEFNECLLCLFTLQKGEYEVPDWLSPGDFNCTACIILSVFTLDARHALYPRKKTFRVAENRCLQCVESIFVNLPQFAKSGLKESLNRFFWYFSLHLFGYFGLVSSLFVSVSVCFTAVLSMAAPSKLTVERPRRRGSPQYIRLRESVLFNLWRDRKEAVSCKFYKQGVCRVPSTSNVDVQS